MAVVGGCCPAPSGAPGVGPEPASRAASVFDRFSISLVHWLAPTAPVGKARSAQLAKMNMVFIGHTPLARRAGGGREPSRVNSHREMAFRRSGRHGVANADLRARRLGAAAQRGDFGAAQAPVMQARGNQ